MRWVACADKLPSSNGRYWVYPYRTLSGYIVVSLAQFTDGDWEKRSREQGYAFWRPLEIPKPPKVRYVEKYCE